MSLIMSALELLQLLSPDIRLHELMVPKTAFPNLAESLRLCYIVSALQISCYVATEFSTINGSNRIQLPSTTSASRVRIVSGVL
jgi:hypothetical protein